MVILIAITIISFSIMYSIMCHKFIKNINLEYPRTKDVVIIVFAGITYFLVLKSLLEYIIMMLNT